MIKWLLNLYENWKDKKYRQRITSNFIESQALNHPTMHPNILENLNKHFQKLEKFKFKKKYKIYCKIITRGSKINFNDFYYGMKDTYYPGLVNLYLRKGSRDKIIVPEDLLFTEKDMHQKAFNSKMDDIIK